MPQYRTYTDKELIPLAAGGDKAAVAELLLNRYANILKSAARGLNSKLSDDDIDDALQAFTERNIKPDTNGNWRLRGIVNENNPSRYISTSFKNYLRDEYRKEKLDFVSTAPEEERTGSDEHETVEDPDIIHPKTQQELQIEAIFEALDCLGDMTPKERYILVTFLLSARFRGDGAKPLKIQEAVSRQLNMNPSTLYNRYSELKDGLKAKAAEYLATIREQE